MRAKITILAGVLVLMAAGCGDSSSSATCGNGVVDELELCDPQNALVPCLTEAQCDDGDPCTLDTYTGSTTECNARCTHEPILAPAAGDSCCPPGANQGNDSDCQPVCGNGVVETGEDCDILIEAGNPGACPTQADCDDSIACTSDTLEGVGCNAHCVNTEITTAGAVDGCCPTGATSATDRDCAIGCGNGVVEPGETCDTAITTGTGVCPTVASCNDSKACTVDAVVGAGTCTAVCSHVVITTLTPGDGCCPATANANTDSDCGSQCGNGAVEAGEYCDTGIAAGLAGACPTACNDGNACTTEVLTGSGCAKRCVVTAVTAPANNDGCCPPGANAANDNDCPVKCGNGAVEQGETCDTAIITGTGHCVTAGECDDSNPCTTDGVVLGGTCKAQCTHVPVVAFVGGDQCCPAGGNANNDSDCVSICGNGVVEAAEYCDIAVPQGTVGACPLNVAACNDSNPCTVDALTGSNCMARCTHNAITTPTNGDSCCPAGANANNDNDCLAVCGNGFWEQAAGESCDTAIAAPGTGSCVTSCNDTEACTIDTVVGTGCGTRCQFTQILTCSMTTDSCCPPGCNQLNDVDCSANCGNGVVESPEYCDKLIPAGTEGACPADCDDADPCTTDTLLGEAANCTARCTHTARTPDLVTSDLCCHVGTPGWDATTDLDCEPVCGNNVWETATEKCDTAIEAGTGKCPVVGECTEGDECHPPSVIGTDCDQECAYPEITECSLTSDGCCAEGCDQTNDADCPAICGNGVVEAGEECDSTIPIGELGACPTGIGDCNDSNDCTADTFEGSACTRKCTHTDKLPNLDGADQCCLPSGDPLVWNANTDSDCQPVCDNGVKEDGEACDTAIPTGNVGACPVIADCDDSDACTDDFITGTACDQVCDHSAIFECCGDGVKEGTEKCDTGIATGQPGACPVIAECDDSDACTADSIAGTACQQECANAAIFECCGDGKVEGAETCDLGITGGADGDCANITCNDGSDCTLDVPQNVGSCFKMCAHVPQFASGDSCCPPTGRFSDDPDCLCGNATPDASASEQCDDGNATNTGDACTNSCTIPQMVGSPCTTSAADCPNLLSMIPGPQTTGQFLVCVDEVIFPGIVNGYCTVALCDPTDATTMVMSCPQPLGPGNPTSLCVVFPTSDGPLPGCVALCNSDADCRIKEANPLGAPAYMCTPLGPGVNGCLPRQPTL